MNSGTQDLPESGAQHSASNPVVRFGAFEVNLSTGELRKDGERVRLQGKPFQILQALLERPGEVVTRDELRKRLWPADFVDFESGLNTAANRLRLTLGDSAENPRYVQTLARTGYRFIAPVTEVLAPADRDIVTPEPAAPMPPAVVVKRSPRFAWTTTTTAIAALVIVLAAIGVYLARRNAVHEPTFRQITFRRGYVDMARFAPDGQTVIYAAKWLGAPANLKASTVSMVSPGSPESRSLDYSGFGLMSVSHTGELLLTKDHSLYRVPMNGGAPKLFLEGVVWADWLPHDEVAIVRQDLGLARVEFPRGRSVFQTAGYITSLRLAPQADALAFVEHSLSSDDGGNVVWIDSRSAAHRVSEGWASIDGLAWSPEGREIWFTASRTGVNRSLYAVDRSGHQREVYAIPGTLTLRDISPRGEVVLSRDTLRQVMSLGSTSDKAVPEPEQDISWFDWSEPEDFSPDGRRLLFTEGGEGGGREYAVYVRDLATGATTRISDGEGLAFMPDGKSVVTMMPRENNHLNIVPLGAGVPRTVSGPAGFVYQWAQVFPDGRRLLVSGNMAGKGLRLYSQSVDGGALTPVEPEVALDLTTISPDGTRIAGATHARKIAIVPAAGGDQVLLSVDAPVWPVKWNADSVRLLIQTMDKAGNTLLEWYDTHSGKLTPLHTLRPPQMEASGVAHIKVSTDDRNYVYSSPRRLSELFIVNGLR